MTSVYIVASGEGIDSLETDISRSVTLEGTTYTLRFRWNTRDESWIINCATMSGVTIFNTKAKTSAVFNEIYKHRDYCPQGAMMILDTAEVAGRVGFETFTLDGRYRLVYVTSE